jgi:hypothetical protein
LLVLPILIIVFFPESAVIFIQLALNELGSFRGVLIFI